MAGIGFTLRRMLQEDGYTGPLKALGYAAVIAAGPWIVSSLSLGTLEAVCPLVSRSADYNVFLAIVAYVFAFALIGVGAVHMVTSRYLADRLFEGRPECFAPAY